MQAFNDSTQSQLQAYSPQTPTQPRILYFISRTNGTLVPLIPADELPFNVRLQGVPRVLTLDQTLGMQHVGKAQYTGQTFRLEHELAMQRSASQPQTPTHSRSQSTADHKQFFPPDALARQAIANSAGTGMSSAQQALPRRPLSAHELPANWRTAPTSDPSDKAQAVIDAIVGSTAGAETAARTGYPVKSTTTPPPSGNVPDQDKKEYCTYWIRHGECDYTQQGCLYKHEMPDLSTLKKIGLRGHPRGWVEKNQAIKLGGEKATVGPVMKPSEWLSKRKGSASDDSNAGDGSSDSETDSTKTESKVSAAASKNTTTTYGDKTPTMPSLHATAKTPVSARKQSDIGDLIDFAPLYLTSSPAPAVTLPSSTNTSSNRNTSTAPKPANDEPRKKRSTKAHNTDRVFVPAGESPEKHITEAKKRASRNCSRNSDVTEAPGIEKQIQTFQKKTYNSLMASKHAVLQDEESIPETIEKHASGTKRPASAAPKSDR